jgi:hypothetical protein
MSNEENKKKIYEAAKDVVDHNDARVALEKYQRLFISELARDFVCKGDNVTCPIPLAAPESQAEAGSITTETLDKVSQWNTIIGGGLESRPGVRGSWMESVSVMYAAKADICANIERETRSLREALSKARHQLNGVRDELAEVKNHLANLGYLTDVQND